MVWCYLAGIFGAVLLFAWWATKPGTDGSDGLQERREKRNDSMI